MVFYNLGNRYAITVPFPISTVSSFIHYAMGGEWTDVHLFVDAIRLSEHWEAEATWARLFWKYAMDSPLGICPWKWSALMNQMLQAEHVNGVMATPPLTFISFVYTCDCACPFSGVLYIFVLCVGQLGVIE